MKIQVYENTDLHIKILFRKCKAEIMELVLENCYKIVVPLFGAAYIQFYTNLV